MSGYNHFSSLTGYQSQRVSPTWRWECRESPTRNLEAGQNQTRTKLCFGVPKLSVRRVTKNSELCPKNVLAPHHWHPEVVVRNRVSQNGSTKRSHPTAQIQPKLANWAQQPRRVPNNLETYLWRAGMGRNRLGEHHRHGTRRYRAEEFFQGKCAFGLPRNWSSIRAIQGRSSILIRTTWEPHAPVLYWDCPRQKKTEWRYFRALLVPPWTILFWPSL